jgi:hypothetical protein
MEIKKLFVSTVAGIALCGSLLSAPAFAEEQPFTSIQGIEAQALSANEMDAIHGADLTAAEKAYLDRLDAAMDSLIAGIKSPTLQAKAAAAWQVTLDKLTAFLTRT